MRPGSLGGTTLVLVQLQYNIGASSSSNSQGLIIMGISLFSLSNNMWCMQPRDTRTHIQKAEIGYKWKFNFSSCTQSQYYPMCHWDWGWFVAMLLGLLFVKAKPQWRTPHCRRCDPYRGIVWKSYKLCLNGNKVVKVLSTLNVTLLRVYPSGRGTPLAWFELRLNTGCRFLSEYLTARAPWLVTTDLRHLLITITIILTWIIQIDLCFIGLFNLGINIVIQYT